MTDPADVDTGKCECENCRLSERVEQQSAVIDKLMDENEQLAALARKLRWSLDGHACGGPGCSCTKALAAAQEVALGG